MKTLYLLITLTQNSAGDINTAFVNTDTLQQCQQKAVMVENVFKSSAIPVIESRCIKSELRFSEFMHAENTRDIRNFYLTHFDEDETMITAMPDWNTCIQNKKGFSKSGSAESGRVYCSSSVQSIQ